MVQPLDLHLVNVGSIPTGPTHGADIIASFVEKGAQYFRPFRIHRVVQTIKYNSLTGRLDRGKEYVMHFEFQSQSGKWYVSNKGPACLAVKPLDLHLVHVGSIPTGPTHGEV